MKKLIAGALAVATVASLSVTSFAVAADVSATASFTADTYVSDAVIGNTDTVKPGKTVYINLSALTFAGTVNANNVTGSELAPLFLDGDLFKVKFDKGDDNTKLIKKMSLANVDVNKDGTRDYALKIELNDDMTTSEYKVSPFATFTAKKDIAPGTGITTKIDKDSAYVVNLGALYISNDEHKADQDYTAGTGGVVLKPNANEENEITWNDENRDVAALNFVADSDAKAFFPKLSTKWGNEEYEINFRDGDAFKFEFVGNPAISSTSRSTLTIYNPFINEDDEYTVDVAELTVYEVVDGEIVDVTANFKAGTNDDGDQVLTLKTRTLGTYIVADAAAAATEVIEDAPVETETGKEVPKTGR